MEGHILRITSFNAANGYKRISTRSGLVPALWPGLSFCFNAANGYKRISTAVQASGVQIAVIVGFKAANGYKRISTKSSAPRGRS